MGKENLRRSTRIAKEVAILLMGSEMEGKSFSETTKAVVLSRDGAGVVSVQKLYPEQEMIVRHLDTNKEAVVRVVGQIGAQGETYTYGVAFVEPCIEFWGMQFPAPSESEKQTRRVMLECNNCKEREMVEQSELESDVLMVNEGIMRYCRTCATSTLWKRSSGPGKEAPTPGVTRPLETAAVSEKPVAEAKPTEPPENRRKHRRMKVKYKACIRRVGFPSDVVECEDMSKGGIRFKSRTRYENRSAIEVAVPYEEGAQGIFVAAHIVYVEELEKEKMYRCGVAYGRAS